MKNERFPELRASISSTGKPQGGEALLQPNSGRQSQPRHEPHVHPAGRQDQVAQTQPSDLQLCPGLSASKWKV